MAGVAEIEVGSGQAKSYCCSLEIFFYVEPPGRVVSWTQEAKHPLLMILGGAELWSVL